MAAKLTPDQRAELIRLADAGATTTALAAQFGVSTARVAQLRSTPSGPGGRHASTRQTVRVEDYTPGRAPFVHVDRALWTALGEPSHLAIYRSPRGRKVFLRACATDAPCAYRIINAAHGGPRLAVGDEMLAYLGLLAGRYAATVGTRIISVDVASRIPDEPEPTTIKQVRRTEDTARPDALAGDSW
jgi:hypothetical protein